MIYAIPQHYNITAPRKIFPILDNIVPIASSIEVENEPLNECVKQVGDFMTNLNTIPSNELLAKLRKLLTVEYAPKKEILRFYFCYLFNLTWQRLPRSDQQFVMQALENYLLRGNCSVSASAILYTAESIYFFLL